MDRTKIKQIDYKVPGGKLLRIKAEFKANKLTKLDITGDFFVYPEEALFEIEKILTSYHISELSAKLNSYLLEHEVKLIGFSVDDLLKALKKLYH